MFALSNYVYTQTICTVSTHTHTYIAKTTQEAAHILTMELTHIHEWLKKSCLLLNTKKLSACIFLKNERILHTLVSS